ncbi:hypothetical protein C8A05DRAFT_17504 [Staphylotrichum tortipilum]|uniref:Zn(2)-C6 fungal-type domain-containing protein n=1 Tax=Staphylotrichum tortipilum TaxID=2831512 RepID=A0AAN6RRC8_9PEZI|nr:hypothetical protein C8A05DRAFT_17504 [Staphylotrichum longicolle]
MPRQHLTPNACLVCRRKRTKCDGQLPCRRCRSRGEECAYEDKKWRTKDHLRSEIERLRTEQRQGHALLRALTNNDADRWETVLDRMRAGDPPETIAESILAHSSKGRGGTAGASPPAFGDDTNAPPHGLGVRRTFGADGSATFRKQSVGEFTNAGMDRLPVEAPHPRRFSLPAPLETRPPYLFPPPTPGLCTPPLGLLRRPNLPAPPPELSLGGPLPHTWTRVTSDTGLVYRLFARFFASSLSYLSLISHRHFMLDFREGNRRYCSEALVNAVLAMACKLATETSQLVSRVSFGDAFMGEAKGLLAQEEDHVNLPCIQALAILALTEMAQGNEEEAGELAHESVRACIRFVLQTQHRNHSVDADFRTVRAMAYCGGFTLLRMLRLLTRDLEPKTGPLFMRLYPDAGDVGDDTPEARIERGISLQVQFFVELQHCPPLARFIFEATEAAHTFSTYHYSEAMTASDLDGAFNRCLSYHRQAIGSGVLDPDGGPDVLIAQIWYNFSLLGLLKPFTASPTGLLDGLPPSLSGYLTPHSMCRQASEAIISLTSTYQTRYSLAFLPPILPYMVFAAAIHQLALVAPLPWQRLQPDQLLGSPSPLSPEPPCGTSYYISSARLGIPHADTSPPAAGSKPYAPEASSPSTPAAMRTPRSAMRKNSVLSSSSACFFDGDQTRRPSVSSFVSSATSEMDGPPSPESVSDLGWDTLPAFTSQPADLVTMASLQLTSMGALHAGAAEAANLLRMVMFTEGMAGPYLRSFFLTESVHVPEGALEAQPYTTVGHRPQEVVGPDLANELGGSANALPGPTSQSRLGVRPPTVA